jgi:hypothetical protein
LLEDSLADDELLEEGDGEAHHGGAAVELLGEGDEAKLGRAQVLELVVKDRVGSTLIQDGVIVPGGREEMRERERGGRRGARPTGAREREKRRARKREREEDNARSEHAACAPKRPGRKAQ